MLEELLTKEEVKPFARLVILWAVAFVKPLRLLPP
jgi:hypothetical protein